MMKTIKKMWKRSKVQSFIYTVLVLLFLISLCMFCISLLKLNGIETLIRSVLIVVFLIIFVFILFKGKKLIIRRKKATFVILSTVAFISIVIMSGVSYYINIIYGNIGNISIKNESVYTGYLISLKDKEFNSSSKIGQIDNSDDIEGYVIANEIIKDKKLKNDIESYSSYEDMIYDLYNNVIDAAFVQSNYISYFEVEESYENISSETKVIYKKSKTVKNKVDTSNGKSIDKPFTMLLMGVDSTLDTIDTTTAFNGDTLMVITFNPKTLNATMFSIPRDLYVPISCNKNNKAKINSSAVGGVSCVTDTIKNLTGVNIDYYAKINFKGLVDLVDALGGVEVDVQKPDFNINHGVNCNGKFCEQNSKRQWGENTIYLEPGYQKLNGEEALAYARCRGLYLRSDLDRAAHQQQIVEAIIKKMISLKSLTDFNDILKSISNNIVTNMSTSEVLSSYDILKSMVINYISSKDPLVIEKASLEVYDMNIYNERNGTHSAVLGYYENSLKSISEAMKVNLELKNPTIIKEFSFDANSTYELSIPGKSLKENISTETVPSFIGKTVTEAETWANNNNITLQKEYVKVDNTKYNSEVNLGLIGNQSVPSGMALSSITSLTVYINSAD